ncbi:Cytoplasmic and mitochondrial histidine tRNA synthetase, partial [Ascosphaera atra]
AEFAYKVKPRLPNQFKSAEQNHVPFAIILGEDELKANKVRVKEMGLPDGHPEKDGILVDLNELTTVVKQKLQYKDEVYGVPEVTEKVGDLKVDPAEGAA